MMIWYLACIISFLATAPVWAFALSAQEDSVFDAGQLPIWLAAIGGVLGLTASGWWTIGICCLGTVALIGSGRGRKPGSPSSTVIGSEPAGHQSRRRTSRTGGIADPGMGAPISEPHRGRLSFVYADADGVVTERSVKNWTEYERHVQGICQLRRAKRTFRKDRVESWIGGEELLLRP